MLLSAEEIETCGRTELDACYDSDRVSADVTSLFTSSYRLLASMKSAAARKEKKKH